MQGSKHQAYELAVAVPSNELKILMRKMAAQSEVSLKLPCTGKNAIVTGGASGMCIIYL